MTQEIVIAGGGIGGLAAAIAVRRAGFECRVLEQAEHFSEAGAGIQLGPNTTGILREWGLLDGAFLQRCVRPERLCVRDARSGAQLAELRLAGAFEARYGAPYLTVHRADLQSALLQSVQGNGSTLHASTRVLEVRQDATGVRVRPGDGQEIEADGLVAADGLWSRLRECVTRDAAPPRAAGHLAYRTLLDLRDAPAALKAMEVTAWFGPRLHVVTYPVRGGESLNVVCFFEGAAPEDAHSWDHEGLAGEVNAALSEACEPLRELAALAPRWRMWAMHDRPPLHGPAGMARGRIALLGDAAHPMLPYLAQGAGMAIEDARELQRVLQAVADGIIDLPTALQRYALNRWKRCARVQRRSQRNGVIFHAAGPLRWGRDMAMRLLGERLLDLPWLYRTTQ